MTINWTEVETKALAALKAAESFFESNPEAKQLADDATAAFGTLKTDAMTAAQDSIAQAVTDVLTPTIGATSAKIAGDYAAQAVIDNADKLVAPVVEKVDTDLDIPPALEAEPAQ